LQSQRNLLPSWLYIRNLNTVLKLISYFNIEDFADIITNELALHNVLNIYAITPELITQRRQVFPSDLRYDMLNNLGNE